MLQPDPTIRSFFGDRLDRPGPVTCAVCGCRLQSPGTSDDAPWFHFAPIAGRDARGCRVACADAAHDSAGRAVEMSVA